jgi:hypothetical protein
VLTPAFLSRTDKVVTPARGQISSKSAPERPWKGEINDYFEQEADRIESWPAVVPDRLGRFQEQAS